MSNQIDFPVYNTPVRQTQPIYQNQPNYQNAGVSPVNTPSYTTDNISTSQISYQPQSQPQSVSVGFMDKVSAYFKDVYRTEANLLAYKKFMQDVEANPNIYLKPGSQDKNRVLELQQKLTMVGIKCNVNGTFGNGTEAAVKEFKEMVNIDDGFLDKKGKPARTGIVTPQMWSILNSMVSKKLSGGSPGSGNPMPVTAEEMSWAVQLQERVKNYGYKPTKQEYTKYNDILERAQNQQIQNQGQIQNTQIPSQNGVTQEEFNWALNLQNKIEKQGYQPTQQEVARYNDIFNRYQSGGIIQNKTVQSSNQGVTQEELLWALNLQEKVEKQGYQPTQQEVAKFNDIYTRYQNSGKIENSQNVSTSSNGVTQEEFNWALNLQNKIEKQGYQPTQEEINRYNDIYNRYQSGGIITSNSQTSNSQITNPKTSKPKTSKPKTQNTHSYSFSGSYIELGYANSQGTKAIWQQAVSRGVAGLSGNWNIDKHNLYWLGPGGEVIKQTEMTQTQATRLNSRWKLVYGNPGGANPNYSSSASTSSSVSTSKSYSSQYPNVTEEELNWATNLYNRVSQGYSPTQEEINRFNEIQLRMVKPNTQNTSTTSTYQVQSTSSMQTASVSQEELNWALDLQNRVQQGYQPTQQEINRYTDIYNRYQKIGVNNNSNYQQVQNVSSMQTASVSQEELNWALDLQNRVQQGYQPTQQEINRYTDIFNRYNASQTANTSSPQSTRNTGYTNYVTVDASINDPELQWALQLLEKYQQGYYPTDQEMLKYEQIIARYSSPAARP